jgi:predicted dienelactone hydrolase
MHFRTNALAAVAVAIAMLFAFPAAAEDHAAGVARIAAHAPERDADLDVTVWYPASPRGETVMLGENPFFEGTPAMQDAPVADGRFSLVVLSHGAGLGGRAEAASWLAAPLAEAGFIVVAPTHPRNTGPDRSAEETMKLWLRPADLSAAIDAIAEDDGFQSRIDAGSIGVLGLSMGGGTALSIAGARFDPERFAAYCDNADRNASLCDWVRMSGVDLHTFDKSLVGRDNRDDRIGFAMAIDPVPADVFAPETFSGVSVPVALVNLGTADDIPETARASAIADTIAGASYTVIEDASHFSMFGECKPGAAGTAMEMGIEDPICADGDARSRAAIHAELVDIITAAFEQALAQEG